MLIKTLQRSLLYYFLQDQKSGSSRRRMRAHTLALETLEPRCLLTLVVPELSSLSGADHTIYLDFDGHVTENTSWNSYFGNPSVNSPAYNIDGDASSFSTTELARITEVWERVAEDFIPFNVNVTTIDPGVEALRKSGSGDTQWGIRVLITADTEGTGAGGIAYIDSFNWNSDTPAFVYNTGAKGVAEAVSHEAGHSLGLSHDGTSTTSYYTGHGSGETSWASLMGVGYYTNVTTWDKGEYYDSNNANAAANYSKGPDDLFIITSYNGFGYRVDDHGDTLGNASALSVSGNSISGSGIVETTGDLDIWSFTTDTGNVSINIDPFTTGPNLDIKADLYNSSGVLVSTSNSSSALDANFSLALSAGQYYLKIDGTGVGDPTTNPPTGYSDYGSLGQYTITGTIVDPGALPELSIGNITVNEGDGTATFTVSLSGSITEQATVDFLTANGSATGGSDYVTKNGTITFNPGDSSKQVSVTLNDDSATESSENFFVNLSNASTGVIITDGQGEATINDNDTNISINDVSLSERNLAKGKKNAGNPTYTDFVFTVNLSNAVGHTVTVDYTTQNGTATVLDNDYQATSGTITFDPGVTSQTVTVTVIGDNDAETDETFTVFLNNALGGNLVDYEGTGTILDDDSGGGGGNGGGGNGGGRGGGPKKTEETPHLLPQIDPLWFFESQDLQSLSTDAGQSHQHEHHLSRDTDLSETAQGQSSALSVAIGQLSLQTRTISASHTLSTDFSGYHLVSINQFNRTDSLLFRDNNLPQQLQADKFSKPVDLLTSLESVEEVTDLTHRDIESLAISLKDGNEASGVDTDSLYDEMFGSTDMIQSLMELSFLPL